MREKAHDATMLLIDCYQMRFGFQINSSFGAYMNFPIKNVLYKRYTKDPTESMDAYFNENEISEDTVTSLSSDMYNTHVYDIDDEFEKRDKSVMLSLASFFQKIISHSSENFGTSLTVKIQLAILIRMRDGTNKLDDFYVIYGSDLKKIVDRTFKLLYIVIKDRTTI